MNNECLLPVIPVKQTEDYFLSQLYQSNHPATETMRILKTLNRYVKCCNRDMFYSIEIFSNGTLRHKPLNDMADDCLIIVSLFSKHIHELHRRLGSPSFHFFVSIGTHSFKLLGYPDIARNYEFWTDFIAEHIFS